MIQSHSFSSHLSINTRWYSVVVTIAVAIFEVTWSLPPPPAPPGVVATCDQRSSCGPNNAFARLSFHARNCFCDDVCRVFDDCCADYKPSRTPSNPLLGHVISGGSGIPPTFTCVRIEDIDTSFEYYIVDRCPRDYANTTVRELCRNENLDDLFYRLPVAGRTSGLLYRNAYCAMCSGEKEYVFWRVVHRCAFGHGAQSVPSPADSEAAIRQLTQCVPDLLPPEVPDSSVQGGKSVLLPRKCKSNVNKCDRRAKGSRRAGRCTGPTSYVYDGLQAYRNEECAQCNGVQSATCEDGRTPQVEDLDVDLGVGDVIGPSGSPPGSGPQPPRRVPPPTTITLVVDLNSGAGWFHQTGSSRDDNSSSQPVLIPLRLCDVAGEVFDPYSQMCRVVKFRPLLTPTTVIGTTTRTTTRTRKPEMIPTVESTSAPTTTPRATTTRPTVRPTTVPTTTSTTATTPTTTTTTTRSTTTTAAMTTTTVAQERLTSSTSSKVGRNKMKTTLVPFLFPVDSYDESDFWDVPPRRLPQTTLRTSRKFPASTTPPTTTIDVGEPREDEALVAELTTDDLSRSSTSRPSTLRSSTSVTTRLNDIATTVATLQSTTAMHQPAPIVPICDLLPVKGDFVMLENGSLSVMTSSSDRTLVYSSHEYTRINDSLFVCMVNDVTSGLEQKLEPRETEISGPAALVTMFQLDRIQSLASLVGVLMSITGLVACLLVVVCLPPLRVDSHGRGLLCLVTSLLVGQSLYLVSTLHGYRVFSAFSFLDSSTMCYWIGVATHYFLLTAFFWINVLAMDTTRSAFSGRDANATSQTQTKTSVPVRDKRACYRCARFAAYSIYAWLVPAAIVAGSVASEHFEVEEALLRARYAASGVCWPAGRQGITLLVGLPLAALTAANLVLYTLALAVSGCDVTDSSVNEPRRRAVSGLLLTVLMALTWAAALVAAYLEIGAVWYVFVGLHACVGLFTCVAFGVNGQTFSMLQRNRKQYRVGCDGVCIDASVTSKDVSNGSGSVNGNGLTPWGVPRHPVPGPVPSYDEVISHETSI